jgi:SAM-dependent methyltransferase
VTSAGIGAAPRPNRAVGVQIARGVGFTVLLLVGLWAAVYVGSALFFIRDFGAYVFHPYWPAVVPVAALIVASVIAIRRMRAWAVRPRWLVPCALLVVGATFAIAFVPFSVTREYASNSCIAITDAWHPVVATPAPADMAVWHSLSEVRPIPSPPYTDPVRRYVYAQHEIHIYRARHARIVATPAYQRADSYIWWTYGQGPCTATSRNLLAASGGVLVLGSAILGVAVRRRRRAYLPGAQSEWSAVDTATDPQELLSGLDALRAEPFFAESKARMAALIDRAHATRVLDVGCGTGEDAIALAAPAVGVERSIVMCTEARIRHAALALVAADATALPIRDASADALRADRVLQHLPDAPAALREWRRVLRRDGKAISFDPDLTTATIEGVDDRSAAIIRAWRVTTRPGAATVHALADAFEAAGFRDVDIDARTLELTDLGRAQGIMGLATWGRAAAAAGGLPAGDAERWSDGVHEAWRAGRLRYRCTYLLAAATAG